MKGEIRFILCELLRQCGVMKFMVFFSGPPCIIAAAGYMCLSDLLYVSLYVCLSVFVQGGLACVKSSVHGFLTRVLCYKNTATSLTKFTMRLPHVARARPCETLTPPLPRQPPTNQQPAESHCLHLISVDIVGRGQSVTGNPVLATSCQNLFCL